MRVGLVADIPDQPVRWRIEDRVQGDREFHHAEARAQMPASRGNRINGLRPQLVSKLLQLIQRKIPQVSRRANAVEQQGGGHEKIQVMPEQPYSRRRIHAICRHEGVLEACLHVEGGSGAAARLLRRR